MNWSGSKFFNITGINILEWVIDQKHDTYNKITTTEFLVLKIVDVPKTLPKKKN